MGSGAYMVGPVMRWATAVVHCRTGVAYIPLPFEMMHFAQGDTAMSPSCCGPCVR